MISLAVCLLILAARTTLSDAADTWMQPAWKYPPAPPQEWFRPTMPEEHVYLDAFTQQLVDPDKDLLTILLPILPSKSELGYVLNQMRTFSRFADMDSILEYLIITPQKYRCAAAAQIEIAHFWKHCTCTSKPVPTWQC